MNIESFFETAVMPVLRVSTPLLFAALGGMWGERTGVIQLGLEGYILVGSFFGAVSALHFQDPWVGLFFAGISGAVLSLLYGVVVLRYRANQIVASTALNLLAMGIPPFLSKIWFDSTGSTPPIPSAAQFQGQPILLMAAAVIFSHWVYYQTRWGLRLRFSGEHPQALRNAGVSVRAYRWQGVILAGFLAGIAGGTLSIYLSSSFIRNMSAGRGFIALAAVILGKWRPIPTALACLLFGITEAIQIRLQGVVLWGTEPVPVQWIQILPYIITIVVLAGIVGRSFAPKGIGQCE
jgi:ABC-type uncharacterized transport system permease subunit